jgi:hypothetical protein
MDHIESQPFYFLPINRFRNLSDSFCTYDSHSNSLSGFITPNPPRPDLPMNISVSPGLILESFLNLTGITICPFSPTVAEP